MEIAWYERGVLTNDAIERCERARLVRAVRLADQTLTVAGGLACRRATSMWPNMAGGFPLDRAMTRADIDRMAAWFAEVGKEARLGVTDRAGMETFAMLATAGFHMKDMVSILARPISEASPPAPAPHGVELRVLHHADADSGSKLARTLSEQFAPPGTEPSQGDIDANYAGIAHPESIVIGAFDGDRCVGGGLVDVSEGTAALWGVAIHPDYRRRGIQSALMTRRIDLARERGATLAFIETTAGGPTHRNAAALGFGLAYTRAIMVNGLNGGA